MLANVVDGMVVMDRAAYEKFKTELYHAVLERPDIKEKFHSQYETLLVMTSNANCMGEDNYGAVLRILLEGNRSITPAYDDMGTLLRRLGWQDGKRELLKPPVSDKTKPSAFDKSIEHFARGMFRTPSRLEVIIEKPGERMVSEDAFTEKSHNVADYFAAGMKYLAGAIKGVANAGVYVVSAAANMCKNRNNLKNMTPEQIEQYRKQKITQKFADDCKKLEDEISSLKSLSERGRIVSIYNLVTGEAVMTEELYRHKEMRFTSLVPELLHTAVQFHIEKSPALRRILEAKVAAMVNGAVEVKKAEDKRKE